MYYNSANHNKQPTVSLLGLQYKTLPIPTLATLAYSTVLI